jgi:oxalate decarboxylase
MQTNGSLVIAVTEQAGVPALRVAFTIAVIISAEWAIMLYGTARITAIDADGKSFVADVKKNDLWFFSSGIPHSIQGLNPDGCEFMLVFGDGDFSESETVLLSDAMAHLTPEVLSTNFGVGEQAFANLPKQELFIPMN